MRAIREVLLKIANENPNVAEAVLSKPAD